MSSKFVWALLCFASLVSVVQADENSTVLPDSVTVLPDNSPAQTRAVNDGEVASTDQVSTRFNPVSEESSLESLMNAEVTSVSRKSEQLSDAPAAITVISQEDIERSGFANVPEVLRLVPGLHVARISSHKWIVSSRGFSNEFANKLLVLVDGRTAYNPAFSGVYWDDQDLMLEDIERIEVIRGPGATIWGANAVNGVINVITKSAKRTQGTLLSTRLGTQEKIVGLRFGSRLGAKTYGRFYFKESRYDAFKDTSGNDVGDSWRSRRAGFRLDWEKNERDSFTLQGDISDNTQNDSFSVTSLAPPSVTSISGKVKSRSANLLGRWTRIIGKDSDMSLQMYVDHIDRESPEIGEKTGQFDLDFNHHFRASARHDIVWGVGYRRSKVDFRNTFTLAINSPRKKTNLLSAFVQDDITLKEDKLRLILGTKVEHNSFTGLEIQPSARMVWTHDDKQTVWAAISRAVRTPAHSDLGLRVNPVAFPNPNPMGPPIMITSFGNPNLRSEELLAHEIGYRVQSNNRFTLDATAFFNRYDNLITNVVGTP